MAPYIDIYRLSATSLDVPRSDPTGPRVSTIKRLFAHSGNRCAFPGCSAGTCRGKHSCWKNLPHQRAKPGSARYDPQQSAAERHGFGNLILMCGRHHDIIDGDAQGYTVDRLLKIKVDHEARSGHFDDKVAEHGARLLVQQPVISANQSGGITAHTINVSIGARRQAKPSSFHRLVVDIENIAAARFMLQGTSINRNVGMLFYNIRIVNSSPVNITINEAILRYRARDRQFSTQSYVLVTGTVWSPAEKEDVDLIIMHLGLNNIIMMNWHNLRVVAGQTSYHFAWRGLGWKCSLYL